MFYSKTTLFLSLFSATILGSIQEEPIQKDSLTKFKEQVACLDEQYKNLCRNLPANHKEAEQKLLELRYEAEKLLLVDSSLFKKIVGFTAATIATIICANKTSNAPVDYSYNPHNPAEYSSTLKAIEYSLAYLDLTCVKIGIFSGTFACLLGADLQKMHHQRQLLYELIKNINVTLANLKN